MKIIEGGFAPLQGGFAPACVGINYMGRSISNGFFLHDMLLCRFPQTHVLRRKKRRVEIWIKFAGVQQRMQPSQCSSSAWKCSSVRRLGGSGGEGIRIEIRIYMFLGHFRLFLWSIYGKDRLTSSGELFCFTLD